MSGSSDPGSVSEAFDSPTPALADAALSGSEVAVTGAVGIDEWQEIADQCGYATFFHTPGWFLAFSRTSSSLKVVTTKFTFPDGVIAILPLMKRRTLAGLSTQYLMGPAGCYGGWISADALKPEHVRAMADWVFRTLRGLVWRLNPLDETIGLDAGYPVLPDTTEMLAIGEMEDEAALLQNYKRSVRKEIRKAEREDFSIETTNKWSEWQAYYGLYEKALLRWGDKATSRYGIDLFSNLFESRSPNVKLWVIRQAGEVVGGNLNFYHNSHCVEWHAAFDDRIFGSGARNMLVHNIVVDAMEGGYRFYDFNPSGGHEGTRAFKKSFGTSEWPANIVRTDRKSLLLSVVKGIAGLTK